jgi:multisubunit Na+/H+ antiporter MnhF subunit
LETDLGSSIDNVFFAFSKIICYLTLFYIYQMVYQIQLYLDIALLLLIQDLMSDERKEIFYVYIFKYIQIYTQNSYHDQILILSILLP